jgi:poly(hydroxyalkanoate) granule-associated protein
MTEKQPGLEARARKLGRDLWHVGLGALAVAGDETRGLFERLRARGEQVEQDDSSAMRKAYDGARGRVRDTGARVEDAFRGTVGSALRRTGVPSRDEIRELIERVEKLTAKVDSLGAAR